MAGSQLGWLSVVAGFTVPIQALAAAFGFLARDSGGGTGMAILASTWLVTAVTQLSSPIGTTNPHPWPAAVVRSRYHHDSSDGCCLGQAHGGTCLGHGWTRFALTGIYESGVAKERASGWFGVALVIVALYGALAFELEVAERSTNLPMFFSLGPGDRVITNSIFDTSSV